VTDESGRYEVKPDTNGLVEMVAAADGFELNRQVAQPGWTAFDFTLRKIVRLPAGEAITLELGPTDSLYGFDDEYRARVVRLTASMHGEVEVRATMDRTGHPLQLSLGHPILEFPFFGLVLTVSEGGESQVLVLVDWTMTRAESFTLVSRFSPR